MKRHIRSTFAFEEHDLIDQLAKNHAVSSVLKNCENTLHWIETQQPGKRSAQLDTLVAEVAKDISQLLRCVSLKSPWAAGLLIYFVVLALVFSSANLVMEMHLGGPAFAPSPLPESWLGKIIYYVSLNADHLMTAGAPRDYGLAWMSECFIIVQVVVSLWIVVILIPMLVTEASSYRIKAEDPSALAVALRKYWAQRYDLTL